MSMKKNRRYNTKMSAEELEFHIRTRTRKAGPHQGKNEKRSGKYKPDYRNPANW